MIWRILLFLALLCVGYVLLDVLVGSENFANTKVHQVPKKRDSREGAKPPGITVPRDSKAEPGEAGATGTGNVTVRITGPVEHAPLREIPQPDGSVRFVRSYALKSKDSSTLREDLQLLNDVEMKLFEVQNTPEGPTELHTATILAKKAYITLTQREDGVVRIEDRQTIDLRDVVLTTTDRADMAGMLLQVPQLEAIIEPDRIDLATTAVDERFTIVLTTERGLARWTGRGLKARLPARGATDGTSEITVNSMPRFSERNVEGILLSELQASGTMHLRRDVPGGVVRVELQDDVHHALARRQAGPRATSHRRSPDRLLRLGRRSPRLEEQCQLARAVAIVAAFRAGCAATTAADRDRRDGTRFPCGPSTGTVPLGASPQRAKVSRWTLSGPANRRRRCARRAMCTSCGLEHTWDRSSKRLGSPAGPSADWLSRPVS